ncbi:BOS complex subunit NCLN [Periplaneta americana]|uniref:BOS complex subunit NCLN n=1 Tax=Periplaneta americana TaxID=6978 RepID=UPI0037E71B59
MWFEADEILEIFRGYIPYYLLIALPIFIIISPVNPVGAAHEFPVHRMQQYDLHGVAHGCRSSSVNLEARSISGWGTSRHCVVTRLEDITTDQFREVRSKAGALLVMLPQHVMELQKEEKQQMMELEEAMMSQEISIPVYFAEWDPDLQNIFNDISNSFVTDDRAGSAAEALLNSVSANGYQIVISASQATARTDVNIATIQGKLSGYGVEEKLPTIAVVAYYDSFGVAPELSFGADSNGSGVVMLLELARLFSQLYSNSKSHARYNIIFLLSGAGKLNYQGSKKWLEDQLDGLEGSLIQDASYILCLDAVASSSSLYLHVSKPPREGSPGALLFKELKDIAEHLYSNVTVEGIHKKINLAEEVLAWEHERYSIRRLPAFTLSSLKSHKESIRASILDVRDDVDVTRLAENTQIIAEALARHIFNLSSGEVFSNSLGVEADSLRSWLDFLCTHPRSAQLLAEKSSPLVNTLKDAMSRYLKEVKVTYHIPDKRDPEFVFYDVTRAIVNVYSVKPAVFDLFLTIAIAIYLGLIYFVIQKFPVLYTMVSTFISPKKVRSL